MSFQELGLFLNDHTGEWESGPVPDMSPAGRALRKGAPDMDDPPTDESGTALNEYTVFLSDQTQQTVMAESGGAARRLAAQCIRRGVEGYTSPGVTIYRVRVVNRW